MSVYPCCECCLTDTPHPYGHETSCKKCNNLTADRLRAEINQLVAAIDRVRELTQAQLTPFVEVDDVLRALDGVA